MFAEQKTKHGSYFTDKNHNLLQIYGAKIRLLMFIH